MEKFKELFDKGRADRIKYEKDFGIPPMIAVMNWDTYEEIAQHDFCRTFCGTPIRVDPFCPDNKVIYVNE